MYLERSWRICLSEKGLIMAVYRYICLVCGEEFFTKRIGAKCCRSCIKEGCADSSPNQWYENCEAIPDTVTFMQIAETNIFGLK